MVRNILNEQLDIEILMISHYLTRRTLLQSYLGGQTNVSYYSHIFGYANKCVLLDHHILGKDL